MADSRHKRDTNARRMPKATTLAGPIALVATAAAVTVGVVAQSPSEGDLLSDQTIGQTIGQTSGDATGSTLRDAPLSRSFSRSDSVLLAGSVPSKAQVVLSRASTRHAIATAKQHLWTTAALNVWSAPGEVAHKLGEVAMGHRVLVTGRSLYGRQEIVVDGRSRWVSKGYLSAAKPLGVGAGLSMAPCPDPGVESGLTASAVFVYRSVCHAFPQITSYGGWDAHGEHASGRAIDIMTSDVALGTAIADFLQAHAAELHLYDILWRQQIWTPERASEGWRTFPSRGSATADHYDHVHVSTY